MSIERLLQLTPPEVKAAVEEICDNAGTWDADWKVLKAAGELLAAAKAASVCPVKVLNIFEGTYESDRYIELRTDDEAEKFTDWLRERMKDKTPPAA